MTHVIPDETVRNMFDQLVRIWIAPAIESRQSKGELPVPLSLFAAQIVFSGEGKPALVRVNTEVRGSFHALVRDVRKVHIGDQCSLQEFEDFVKWEMDETDDPNCGYVTLLGSKGKWRFFFDLRYNRVHCERHIEAATQFLCSASGAAERLHWIPFVDSLYAAAELAAKAFLFSVPATEMHKTKKHTAIHSRLNVFSHTGHIDPAHAASFNRLYELKNPTRYLEHEVTFSHTEAEDMLEQVQNLIDDIASALRLGEASNKTHGELQNDPRGRGPF